MDSSSAVKAADKLQTAMDPPNGSPANDLPPNDPLANDPLGATLMRVTSEMEA
jgi:hypothetical protein